MCWEYVDTFRGEGNLTHRFVYAEKPHSPSYMVKIDPVTEDEAVYRMITDHLGSVRMVVDVETGAIVKRMDYGPFGQVIADTNPGFQPFGFAGGVYDRDTGLVRFGARDYDPETGRWTAKDPIDFQGEDSGLFLYSGNDPVNTIEPSGLVKWEGTGLSFVVMKGGGVIYDIYNLTSECVLGFRYSVEIHAKGGAAGLGKKIHPNQIPLATAAGRKFEFNDDRVIPDPSVFDGEFRKAAYGGALGIGIGGYSIRIGEATSHSAISPNFGLDASIGVAAGTSSVVSSIETRCGCE